MSKVVQIGEKRYPPGSKARHALYGFVEVVSADHSDNTRLIMYTTYDEGNEPSVNTTSVHVNELSTDNAMLYLFNSAIPSGPAVELFPSTGVVDRV